MKCNCNKCSGYIYSTNPATNTFNECKNKCVDIWDGNIEVNKYCTQEKNKNLNFISIDDCLSNEEMLVKQVKQIREIASKKRELAKSLQDESNAYYEKYKELEQRATVAWDEYDQLIANANRLTKRVNNSTRGDICI